MKTKMLIMTGLIAAAVSPAMADELKATVDKNTGEIHYSNEDSARLAKMLDEYNAMQKLSDEIKAERTTCKSKNGTWYDGSCIPENPCKSKKASDAKKCITTFDKVQVASSQRGANIVLTYAKNVLKWEGCADLVAPKSKKSGQDYIKCINPADGDVRMFEFDDLSESVNVLADNNYYWAMCIAVKGKADFPNKKATEVVCSNVNQKTCETSLSGAYKDGKCTTKF